MKKLIVYYSRTGKNRKIAEEIHKKIGGDIEEIIDLVNRKGFIGILRGGKDAFLKRKTKIKPPEKDPSGYDFLVIGTPVWAGNITPAIRTYLMENKEKIKKLFLFSVSGFGEKNRKISSVVESITGKKPVLNLFISEKEIGDKRYNEKIEKFIKELEEFESGERREKLT